MKPSRPRSRFVSPKDAQLRKAFVNRLPCHTNISATGADCNVASQNATKVLCSAPIRDESNVVSYSGVIGGVLAVVAYLLRMASRLPRFGGSLGWDDAVITLAILEVIPLSVLSVVCESFRVS